MQHSMNRALRTCLRTSPSSSFLRCPQQVGQRCLASAAYSPRASTSSISARRRRGQVLRVPLAGSRGYSSTREGTIGRGEQGVPDEALRERQALQVPEHLNAKEQEIWSLLNASLNPSSLEVQDISGGCGSMYGIDVVSERFRGLSMLKQQRLVNEVLKGEIGGWHGMQLKTRAP